MLNLSSYRHGNKKPLLRHTCDKFDWIEFEQPLAVQIQSNWI